MSGIRLAPATWADRDDIFDWRNDELTRMMSIDTAPISHEIHLAWFKASLASGTRTIYVGTSEAQKIGAIRFDRENTDTLSFLVSIMIAPAARGRGYGKLLLQAGLNQSPEDAVHHAEIGTDNKASQRIFEVCGFSRTGISPSGLALYRRMPQFSSGGLTSAESD